MTQFDKLIIKFLKGRSDANFPFSDLRKIFRKLGFEERVEGSHHTFRKSGIREIIVLQKDQAQV